MAPFGLHIILHRHHLEVGPFHDGLIVGHDITT